MSLNKKLMAVDLSIIVNWINFKEVYLKMAKSNWGLK